MLFCSGATLIQCVKVCCRLPLTAGKKSQQSLDNDRLSAIYFCTFGTLSEGHPCHSKWLHHYFDDYLISQK